MDNNLQKQILRATGASEVLGVQKIQDLWSGYGVIARYRLGGAAIESVVVKHIRLPQQSSHPRGWNTDHSHERKKKSYIVEGVWYRNWSHLCDANSRVAKCYALDSHENETWIVLEDLAHVGFPSTKTSVTQEEIEVCVRWLAYMLPIWEKHHKGFGKPEHIGI